MVGFVPTWNEFINVKCGNGNIDALFEAQPDANISPTWRLLVTRTFIALRLSPDALVRAVAP
jgi:hypothetical protein